MGHSTNHRREWCSGRVSEVLVTNVLGKVKEIRTSERTNAHNILFAPDMTKLEREREIERERERERERDGRERGRGRRERRERREEREAERERGEGGREGGGGGGGGREGGRHCVYPLQFLVLT